MTEGNPVGDAQPLAGVTVVEICHSISGPYGGSILAMLGAEVIKVENPDIGDYARDWGPPYWHGAAIPFQTLNRDKLGTTVNLRDPEQLEALRALIVDRADVVIQNLRPGTIDSYGLDGPTLLQTKPSLVYCNLGAFGAVGPLREKPGYDPLMQACGGLMSVTGEEGGAPVRIGTSIVDMGSGMWLAIGVLAALHQRAETGKGCVVDTSLFETAIAWMAIHIGGYFASGVVRQRMGSGIQEIVPHQAFPTSDGHVMVAAGNDKLFARLAAVLGHPEWADDPRFASNGKRVENRHDLIAQMSAVFAGDTAAAWLARLDAAGVPNAPIQSIDQVVAYEQTQALQMLQAAPDKDMTMVGLPLSFDGVRPAFRRSAPALGEHNDSVFTAAADPRRAAKA
jgi:crotonobetainyl-CoA:carnitine CoA-transferase CaiB-like acyl-CoA transferase